MFLLYLRITTVSVRRRNGLISLYITPNTQNWNTKCASKWRLFSKFTVYCNFYVAILTQRCDKQAVTFCLYFTCSQLNSLNETWSRDLKNLRFSFRLRTIPFLSKYVNSLFVTQPLQATKQWLKGSYSLPLERPLRCILFQSRTRT